MIDKNSIKVWRISSRWSNQDSVDTSILDIFGKYNIAIVGKASENINEVEIGDIVAIGDGNTIVAVGIVTGLPKAITEMLSLFEVEDQHRARLPINDKVKAFKIVLFNLEREHRIKYPGSNKFHKAGTSYANKIKSIIFDNFIYLSETFHSNRPLPFALKQIKIADYQEIKKVHVTNLPVDTQIIFLTGENGFGKTSVLQALVIGLFGNKDGNKILDKTEAVQSITEILAQGHAEIYYSLSKSLQKFKIFAAYGAARLNKHASTSTPLRTHSLFNTYGDLLDIEDEMIKWEGSEKQKKYYEATREILLKLMSPYLEDLLIKREGSKTDVVYKETDSSEYKPFLELASGFRSIIAMIGDMIIRLSEEQPNIDDFTQLAGIVIIDEFDLHLHPKMQRELVERLTDTFPKVQFIVSTHSPIPFLGAPKNSVFIKVDRDKEKGITLEKLDIDISKLTPNTILTSPVFGFEDINSGEVDIDQVETADRYSNVEAEKRMKKKLKILKQNDEDFFNSLKVL